MRTVLIIAAVLWPSLADAQTYTGPAEIIDGDSLTVAGSAVRLFGIDAPEGQQTCIRAGINWRCGEEAADQLCTMIGNAPVECRELSVDKHKRSVAICSVDGIELNRAMVEAGWATAYRRYSEDYVVFEARAKAARLGIWGSEFDLPEHFRATQENAAVAQPQRPARADRAQSNVAPTYSGCAIKGNRNRKGQWIFHVPGMPYYEATRPEEIFCTEAQAQAAGYRRAIVR